ncbi:MAG: argininosuccinate lyase [Nitrospirota bacterium]
MKTKVKPWGGRFIEETNKKVEEFTASISYDKRLYRHDIKGSIAHCLALARAGILSGHESETIIKGLKDILADIEGGRFTFSTGDEDIHMAIEKRLIEKTGDIGKKLHTGRSRNDQVALDIRLYLTEEIDLILKRIGSLQAVIVELARNNIDLIMPGYTHMQAAQPVLFSHYILAYYEMLERDKGRFEDCLKRVDSMPLGSGAIVGSNYPVDREFIAAQLGFSSTSNNSVDAVSDRDFALEFLAASAITMMHLSRLSEELVLWSTSEFGYVDLPDAFCTGSSMMPQKKNPDVPELIRGKSGRVYGSLVSLLVTMKSLPLAYNRDLQEDKEPIFDTVDTIKDSLEIYAGMLKGIKLDSERIRRGGENHLLLATDLADYLVMKGLPFRMAHEVVGRIVQLCIENKRRLDDLSLEEFKSYSELFGFDLKDYLSVERSINRKDQTGGTSRKRVEKRITEIEALMKSPPERKGR